MATKYLAVDELLKQKAQLWDEHGVGIYAVGTGNILAMPAADVVSMDRYINAIKTINMMSKVLEDFAPVKHGKWLYNNLWGTECSECGTAMFEIIGVSYSSFKPKYCPNCGAKMDK